MSDTLETDDAWDESCPLKKLSDYEKKDFARRLERERDAERALADRLAVELETLIWPVFPNTAKSAIAAWKEARGE